MKNILFLHQSAELYGSDKTILMFICSVDKTKYKPIVVIPFEGPLTEELRKNDITVIIAPVLKLYRKMFTPAGLLKFAQEYQDGMKALEDLHKKYNFSLVYSHTLAVLIGILFARKLNIKHLWHVQEILAKPKLINQTFKKLLSSEYNDIAIYDSKETMRFWIEGNEKLTAKSDFVWNGLDVSKYQEVSEATIEGIRTKFFQVTKDETVIGLVGRINSWKGQQLLLEAFNKIAAKYPEVKLVFIGSAPPNQEFFEEDLIARVKEFKLQERVVIIPFQTNINDFWASIDIASVPSTEPEPFGMVAIEAMLHAKPVVAADHGGLTEIVLPGETGFLFKNNNADSLAVHLEKVIVDKDMQKRFGKAGKERVYSTFTLEKHTEKIEKIFEDILEK
ncbi:MAG: glycosyltransferase family 4 protein [Flavobacterium sp.]